VSIGAGSKLASVTGWSGLASWPGLEGCLRITVGTPAEDDALIAALKEIL
jgi:hypothetical protein